MRSLLPTRTRFGRRPLLLAVWMLGLTWPAAATHLLGGEARYRFLDQAGTTPGRPFRYEITLSIYYNCEVGGPAGSNFPCGRALLGVSIFDKATGGRIEDPTNPTSLDASDNCPGSSTVSQAAAGTFPFFRTNDSIITTTPAPGCLISAGCTRVVNYTNIVELPFSAGGYYVLYSDNARNNSVTNILATGGGSSPQVLQLEIPRPTDDYANASPVFSDVPVPLICSGDTVTLSNNAFDAEGDQLVYSFYAPYDSPNPTILNNTSSYVTPSSVSYATGFSFTQPFGAGGYAAINPITGESRYLVPNAGDYVVGVQVNEFRIINGADVLLSTIYREIQLKVRQCPNNTPPSLQLSTGQNTRTIEEGEAVTFTANAAVTTGNSITLTAASPLLDGPGAVDATFNAQVGTAPGAPVTVSGTSSLAGTFELHSACGSAGQYNVNISARDNDGCPIQATSIPFLLTIRRWAAPASIRGNVTAQPNTPETYTAGGVPTGTTALQWTAAGGAIQGSATDSTVTVRWTTPGAATLRVVAMSARGCPSEPLELPLTVVLAGDAEQPPLALSLAPNPTADGRVLVRLSGEAALPAAGAQLTLTVRSVLGQQVLRRTLTVQPGRETEVDLSALPRGVYVVQTDGPAAALRGTLRLIRE